VPTPEAKDLLLPCFHERNRPKFTFPYIVLPPPTTTRTFTGNLLYFVMGGLLTLGGAVVAKEQTVVDHWAFTLPQRHETPPVRDAQWSSRAHDVFILKKIEETGLEPNPPAGPSTLLRRLSFDLTGLPPTPEEMAAFDQAFQKDPEASLKELTDRLLASPQFGARWARIWLDLARYAEDQAHIVGNNSQLFYPNAWLFRDWVIEAFNRDLPYDQFIKLQLAADLLEENHDHDLAALGFIGLGPKYYRRNDPLVMADEWEDRVDTVSRGLLGLTVGCARCHDHKFDPISTEDYYGLAGVFASIEMFNRPLEGKTAEKPEDTMHIVRDRPKPSNLKVHLRGNPKDLGPEVPRRFLTALSKDGNPPSFQKGSGRLELAEAIASPGNALTARVFVNRIWGELFGTPLVTTSSNFGTLGTPPSHPELLDDLAVRFMESGWSVKWLMRELVLSSTYRQSSDISGSKLDRDPTNTLYSRANRRRLDVEMWRDAIYTAAGTLDLKVGGPSFEVSAPDANRRAVYARISRLKLDPMLALFDFPDPNLHSPGRYESTTPLQKLFAINNPLMVTQAGNFSARLYREMPADDPARIQRAYQLLYGRKASDEEETLSLGFLNTGGDDAWQNYAQVLLASNELLYLD